MVISIESRAGGVALASENCTRLDCYFLAWIAIFLPQSSIGDGK